MSLKYGLCVGYWNIDGLKPKHHNKSKDDDFIGFVNKHDIVGIGETHLTNINQSLDMPNYVSHSVLRPRAKNATRDHGGISILYKKYLKSFVTLLPRKETNYVWVKIDKTGLKRQKDLYACFLHIPPEHSTYFRKIEYDIFNNLYNEIESFKISGEVILIGDLNGRVGTLKDNIQFDQSLYIPVGNDYKSDLEISERINKDKTINSRGKDVIDLCITSQLRILNGRTFGDLTGELTFYKNGVSAIDLCLADENCVKDICFFTVNDLNRHLSDHCSISVMIKAELSEEISQPCNKFTLQAPYSWAENSDQLFMKAALKPEIQNYINNFVNELDDTNDINYMVKTCTDIFHKIANSSLKRKKLKHKLNKNDNSSWFDNELTHMRKVLRQFGRSVKNKIISKHDLDKLNFLSKQYKHVCKRKQKEHNNKLLEKLEKIKSSDPKEGWETLKRLRNETSSNHGTNHIDPNNWLNHYKSLNNLKNDFINMKEKYSTKVNNLKSSVETCKAQTLNQPLTLEELNIAISNLKKKKSPGQDLISNEMLKHCDSNMQIMILAIFNKILSVGDYPTQWAVGLITSIFKSGDINDTNNYRGITITSCVGKLFNSILNSRLSHFNKINNINRKEQIAYQKKSNTTDHIFTLNTIIEKYKKNKKPIFACFIDMKKAFDSVLHETILIKLLKNNINGNFLNVIESMYRKNKICVKLNQEERTEYFTSNVGIRQGDNLSPNLFNLTMNNLPDKLSKAECHPIILNKEKVSCLMYADDIILLSETQIGLQQALNTTIKYSYKQGLELNTRKTKVVYFNQNGKKSNHKFYANNKKLEEETEYKYLGLNFKNSGSLKLARNKIYQIALKAVYKIQNIIKSMNINVKTCLHLFDTLVTPILMYGSEITCAFNVRGDSNYIFENVLKSEQELIHIRFCKYLMGVNKKASNLATLGEFGRYPIFLRSMKQIWKLIEKCKNCDDDNLLKHAYEENKTLELPWYKFVKTLTCEAGISDIEEIFNKELAFLQLKTKYTEFWKGKLFNDIRPNAGGNKLRSYRLIKNIYELEPYLNIKDFKIRQAIAKFRISNHRLRIETGRYDSTPLDERICLICRNIEDEQHVLLNCTINQKEREILFAKISDKCKNFNNLNDKNKFIYIMSISEKSLLLLIANFIYDSLSILGCAREAA